jgi:hypothetical protein
VRISSQAMNAALVDLQSLSYSTKVVSAYEAYLAAKWLEGQQIPKPPNIETTNEAVRALFVVAPNHPFGRLYPFRYDWKDPANSGRKTVWNNTTRQRPTLAASLFANGDFRDGLLPNAATLLSEALPNDDGNPRRPTKQSLICLVLRNYDFAETDDWPQAEAELIARLALTPGELALITSPDTLGVPLLGPTPWSIGAIPAGLAPQNTVRVQAAAAEVSVATNAAPAPEVTVVIEQRLQRMLCRALARYPCILLVGPPGTGKGTLIRWLTNEAQENPSAFGFQTGLHPDPLWRTPDESWTAFELIGGYTPSSTGELSWSPGIIMNCIKDDRWLVLDETNRADMDKIMGPLLTWLSEQEVEIARTKPDGGRPIHLGWTRTPESHPGNGSDGPERYLAGKDWRLLGTYNPQDAQRVFRFGQALSRRFVLVPVPALRPGQFTELLEASYPDAPDEIIAAITGIYSAHLGNRVTSLGPAVFLRMAKYVHQPQVSARSGPLNTNTATLADAVTMLNSMENSSSDPQSSESEVTADSALQARGDQLLAEAYVLSVGKYLASFDDSVVTALGTRIVDDEAAFTSEQWQWVLTQRDILG